MGIWSFQLAFDCQDPTRLCDFWHRALRYGPGRWLDDHRKFLELHPEIVGKQGVCQHPAFRLPRLYMQKVPEPKTSANRIRPEVSLPRDLFQDEVERLLELGAEPIGESLLRDPEGDEVCIVPGGDELRVSAIEIDALDPAAQEAFWGEALGDAFATFPPHPSPQLRFVAAAEPKRVKNRLHLDLNVTDGEDSLRERQRLTGLGAGVLRPEENGNAVNEWSDDGCVMRDPEGNEFCLQATKR